MSKKGVFDIDKGWSKVMREMKRVTEVVVDVGVQAGEKAGTKDHVSLAAEQGIDLVGVAVINEFGTENIPSRPFMRQSFDQHKEELNSFMQGVADRTIMNRISAGQGLNLVGKKMTGIIQKQIVDGSWTLNTVQTVLQKGSDKPLIDTGRLRQSIRHVVKPK